MNKIIGGCLCGAVRYESKAEPLATGVCHCRNCQKQAGSAFSILLGVPKDSLHITGALRTYEDHGDDGGRAVQRKFCGQCGSPILSLTEMTPGIAWLKAGTLDDPSTIKPAFQCWQDSAQAWLNLGTSLPSFARNPELA